MRLLTSTIPNECDLILHGDTHEGNKAAFVKGIDRLLEWTMAQPNRFYVHMSDAIEARTVDHPYFDIDTTVEGQTKPVLQCKSVVKRYEGTQDRCLAWLHGNHEYALQRFGNLTQDYILDQLKIRDKYGGATCKLKLTNKRGRQIAKLYLHHPYRFSLNSHAKDEEQRLANDKARLKWFLRKKASDCLVMAIGHVHKLYVVEPVRMLLIYDDGKGLQQEYLRAGEGAHDYIEPDRRYYVATGSYLRSQILGADCYSEIYGYNPTELGHVVIEIRNGKIEAVKEVVV